MENNMNSELSTLTSMALALPEEGRKALLKALKASLKIESDELPEAVRKFFTANEHDVFMGRIGDGAEVKLYKVVSRVSKSGKHGYVILGIRDANNASDEPIEYSNKRTEDMEAIHEFKFYTRHILPASKAA